MNDAPGGPDKRRVMDEPADHNDQRIAEANSKKSEAAGDSSGVAAIDKLNQGARQVLGDAQVDYDEAEIYMEPDEAVIEAEAAVHGDHIERKPDGTHEAMSVAPGPADDPAGGWADKPVGRKGDGVFEEDAEAAKEHRSHWGE